MPDSRFVSARRLADRNARPQFVLALDTSLGAVSACLLRTGSGEPDVIETLPMQRGHAEALLPLLDRLVAQVEGGFSAIGRVAVTVGPGSFTGIRVGVAAARALGLACKVPVIGISTLAALAAPSISANTPSRILAAIDARHGCVYAQGFATDGSTLLEARHAPVADVLAAMGPGPLQLVGPGASMLAIEAWSHGIAAEAGAPSLFVDIAFVARLGMLADPDQAPPKPLYLKPADAKPQVAAQSSALVPSPAPL